MPPEKDTPISDTKSVEELQSTIDGFPTISDMKSKSQAEIDRAEATKELPGEMWRKGIDQKRTAEDLYGYTEQIGEITTGMLNESDRVEKGGESSLGNRINGFALEIEELIDEFKETLPEKIIELSKKYPETEDLGKEVKKIVEYFESLERVKSAVDKSMVIQKTLPDEILKSLEKIGDKAFLSWAHGDQEMEESRKLEGSNPIRVEKLNAIIDNAKKNLEPIQRTVGRENSKKVDTHQRYLDRRPIDQMYKDAVTRKPEERIRSNMEKQGRSQEEIQAGIDRMKARINQSIEQEKAKSPSPYTTPQP